MARWPFVTDLPNTDFDSGVVYNLLQEGNPLLRPFLAGKREVVFAEGLDGQPAFEDQVHRADITNIAYMCPGMVAPMLIALGKQHHEANVFTYEVKLRLVHLQIGADLETEAELLPCTPVGFEGMMRGQMDMVEDPQGSERSALERIWHTIFEKLSTLKGKAVAAHSDLVRGKQRIRFDVQMSPSEAAALDAWDCFGCMRTGSNLKAASPHP